jgi:amidophosphoribosyltransferase
VLNRRVVLIDDSIVRGNHHPPLVRSDCAQPWAAGASEVHLRITCPPIRHPCFMGVDMGTYDELVAYKHSLEEIRRSARAFAGLHFIKRHDESDRAQ